MSAFSHQLTQLIEGPTTTELIRTNLGFFTFANGRHSHLRVFSYFLSIFVSVESEDNAVVRINWSEEKSWAIPTRIVTEIHHQTPSEEELPCLRITWTGDRFSFSRCRRQHRRHIIQQTSIITSETKDSTSSRSTSSQMNFRHDQSTFSSVTSVAFSSIVSWEDLDPLLQTYRIQWSQSTGGIVFLQSVINTHLRSKTKQVETAVATITKEEPTLGKRNAHPWNKTNYGDVKFTTTCHSCTSTPISISIYIDMKI